MASIQKRTHVPAFLLLFLRESADYGAGLLAKMKSDMPYLLTDSTNVYRCLQELEEKGQVTTTWEISHDHVPRKWYSITQEGINELDNFHHDIFQRHANLSFFLTRYTQAKSRDKAEEF